MSTLVFVPQYYCYYPSTSSSSISQHYSRPPPPPPPFKTKLPVTNTTQVSHHKTTQSPPLSSHWPQLLQFSIQSGYLSLGLALHAFLLKLASSSSSTSDHLFQCNNLINMYVKFNRLFDAQQLFDKMPTRNTITWTSLMKGYSQSNDVFSVFRIACDMCDAGVLFSDHTCTVLLQACGSSAQAGGGGQILGQQVHGLVIKMGFEKKVFVATSLISMYSKCDSLDDAERIFKGLAPHYDIQCFNTMILGYGKGGDGTRAIQTFCDFLTCSSCCEPPNDYTFTNVISACAAAGDDVGCCLEGGRQLHGLATKYGYVRDVSICNALVTMYGKYGSFDEAEKMFCGMGGTKNLVSWTALLSGYAKHGKGARAVCKFVHMLDSGICFDSRCLATVIDAATSEYKSCKFGVQVHGLVMKFGYLSDAFVGTALIDNYVKLGCLTSARHVFKSLLGQHNFTCYNAILRGYFGDEEEDSMALFSELRSSGMEPDSVTFSGLLSLYGIQASIVKGRSIHAYTIKVGLESELLVSNSIITMYSKCGSIEDACRVFYGSIKRDLITWNAMISGYALHGRGEEGLFLFECMKRQGFVPDGITILAVLQACCYSGLFEDGLHIFKEMESVYEIKPVIEHYTCVVDLLSRAGNLSKAVDFIKESPFSRSPMLWRSLVNACKLHRDSNFGILASKHLLDLLPEDAASYVLVSNVYTQVRMLDEAAKVRTMISDKKLSKAAGCSWIEIENQLHRFVANDKHHPSSGEIYTILSELTAQMKERCDPTKEHQYTQRGFF